MAHSREDWEEFVRLDRPGEVSGTGRMALRSILREATGEGAQMPMVVGHQNYVSHLIFLL